MGFFSFLGRVLFASLFILSAWQMFNEFGDDGGPAAKELAPKIAPIQKYLTSNFGDKMPIIDTRHLVAASMFLKGLGGILFVIGSPIGAYLLMYHLILITPLLHDFYNYAFGGPEFFAVLEEFLQSLALFGALLFFIGMKNSFPRKKQQIKKKTTTKPKTT